MHANIEGSRYATKDAPSLLLPSPTLHLRAVAQMRSINYHHPFNSLLAITLNIYEIGSRFQISKGVRIGRARPAIACCNGFAIDIKHRNFHDFRNP